jgi:PleD family two-component response regulator
MDKPNLLIVEDDLDLSEMVSSYFRVQNYDVVTAAWGEEALKLADEQTLDLIMLDIRLPDIDGFELCRQLRENRKTQDVPIIFLTEKRDRVDKLQGLELGVVDYITKPFDIQELRLRVRNAIQRAQITAHVNPVTELPEGNFVDEKIAALLKRDDEWGLLQFSIESLGDFRALYGFVAADDVLRAVTLMVKNAVRQHGDESDFIGHRNSDSFVIITNADAVDDIQDRISRRIRQSREYFYPCVTVTAPKKQWKKTICVFPAVSSRTKINPLTMTKYGKKLEDLLKALDEAMESE